MFNSDIINFLFNFPGVTDYIGTLRKIYFHFLSNSTLNQMEFYLIIIEKKTVDFNERNISDIS